MPRWRLMSAWIAGRPRSRSRIVRAASSLDALIRAIQQLAEMIDGAWRQFSQSGA